MSINTAIEYLKQHRFAEAESLLKKEYQSDSTNGSVIASLILSLIHQSKFKSAQKIVIETIENQQFEDNFYINFGLMFLELKQANSAVVCFEKIIAYSPDNSNAIYNLAFCYNKNNQPDLALKYYQQLVSRPLDYLGDVHLNIANILCNQQAYPEAINQYQKALSIDPINQKIMFNLASLFEQINKKNKAKNLFHNLLSIDPNHIESMVRLIYMEKIQDDNNRHVNKVSHCLNSIALNDFDKEMAHYGLGKAYDDLGQYDVAFANYKAANEMGKLRLHLQTDSTAENVFNVGSIKPVLLPELEAEQIEPIFICGMYRSGSTLIENFLCSHSEVDAGREFDFFKIHHKELIELDQCSKEQQLSKLIKLRKGYCETIKSSSRYMIDKSPTNIKYIGLIKAMFPKAKIIISRRNALDCCLSLYFQMFNVDLPFANELNTIMDEYVSCEMLVKQHLNSYADIYTQNYEDLVLDQMNQTRAILNYCGLKWQSSCLNFFANDSHVNTASIWQVRQPIYKTSIGRWRNYESHIKGMIDLFSSDGDLSKQNSGESNCL